MNELETSPKQQQPTDAPKTAKLVEALKPGEVVQISARVRTGLGGKIFNGYVQSVEPGLLEIVQSGKHIWIPIDDITAIKKAGQQARVSGLTDKLSRGDEPLGGTPPARGGFSSRCRVPGE